MNSIISPPCDAEKKYFDLPEVIFHYTTPEGLINILDQKELWFSRFDCLNDESEGKYILSVYKKAVESLFIEKEIDAWFLEQIEDVRPDFLHFFRLAGETERINKLEKKEGEAIGISGIGKSAKPYLCCFSMERDSLPMWNYYSKGNRYEGYNIGFRYKETIQKCENVDVLRVIYNETDQVLILKAIIDNAYKNYTLCQHSIELCRRLITSALSSRSLQFKHEAFEYEKEVRLVLWEPENYVLIDLKKEILHYRQKKGIIIPFYKVAFNKGQVKSLMIGPLIQTKIATDTAKSMLINKEYSDVIIDYSRIPIRY